MNALTMDRAVQRDVGPLRLARHAMMAGSHTLPDDRGIARERTMSILFQRSGRSSLEQLGNHVSLKPGDATLCDHAMPYELHGLEPGEYLILRVPARLLKDHLPSPNWYSARLLVNDRGMNAVIMAMIEALLDDLAPGDAHQARLAGHLLDLIATSYAIAFEAHEANSSIVVGRLAAVKLHIEQNLREPGLTPCSIATSLKLSPRYLRLIFAATDETVSAYILRRRLDECAKQIADPRWRGHSMTEIAFAWGFNSAPHFTRSFRDRFATAPRDYRRVHLEAAGNARIRRLL
jgi:AraC family transcriptional regulator, positive regulator of tynA and feaB